MMRNTITRTMSTSVIHGCMLVMNEGKSEVKTLDPVTIGGKATVKDAEKALKKIHGKDAPITVTNIEVNEDVYEISVEDFMKYAKKVDKAQKDATEPDDN